MYLTNADPRNPARIARGNVYITLPSRRSYSSLLRVVIIISRTGRFNCQHPEINLLTLFEKLPFNILRPRVVVSRALSTLALKNLRSPPRAKWRAAVRRHEKDTSNFKRFCFPLGCAISGQSLGYFHFKIISGSAVVVVVGEEVVVVVFEIFFFVCRFSRLRFWENLNQTPAIDVVCASKNWVYFRKGHSRRQ